MQVRFALLSLLLLGDGYGQQLAREFERRTGRAVNAGQVSTTLERLLRDGLVDDAGEVGGGRRRVALTMTGRDAVERWAQEGGESDSGTALALLASVDRELAIDYARSRSRKLQLVIGCQPDGDEVELDEEALQHSRWRRTTAQERDDRLAAAESAWLEDAIRSLEEDAHGPELPFAAEPRRGRPQRAG